MIRQMLFGAAAVILVVNMFMHSGASSAPMVFTAASSGISSVPSVQPPVQSTHPAAVTVEALQAQLQARDAQIRRLEDEVAASSSMPPGGAAEPSPSKTCAELRERHGVVVGESWGTLSVDGQNRWNELACDQKLATSAVTAPPQTAAATEPPVVATTEQVPEAERVIVPEGDPLPAQLRQLRRGTDIFVSFASSSMAPFALNWVANLRKSGVKTQLLGTLDDKMLTICKDQGIMVRTTAHPCTLVCHRPVLVLGPPP